ncbi:hypothetical protein [Vibrio owensii]|uniref:hypothetical protein n=1 Tax=Vibrio owensii TaxID=696485 RepID=UPI0018F15DA1|nr:hypothetical protein [Vibrio owensii]
MKLLRSYDTRVVKIKSLFTLPLTALLFGCAGAISGNFDTVTITPSNSDSRVKIEEQIFDQGSITAKINRVKVREFSVLSSCGESTYVLERTIDPNILWNLLIDFGVITIPIELLLGSGMQFDPLVKVKEC